jgi:hypothetical protein
MYILILLNILLILFNIINSSTDYSKFKQWTTEDLQKYTIKNYKNSYYYIVDPNNYIEEDEKEVLYYRLKDFYNKLNFNAIIIVINKISESEKIDIDKDENFDDEFTYENNKGNSSLNNSNQIENTNNIKNFLNKYNKLTLKENIISNDMNYFQCIFTINDIGMYCYTGKNVSKILLENEIENLLTYKDLLIKKNKTYEAIDQILVNFLYAHAKTSSDKFYAFIGTVSEFFVIIVVIGFYIYNSYNNKEDDNQTQNQNQNQKDVKKNNNKENKNKKEKNN